MIMNSTSARWVIAHSERLKRFMRASREIYVQREPSLSPWVDGAHLRAGCELLHPERDDLVAIGDAGADERRILGEGGDGHRPQLQRARFVDQIDRWPAAAVEDRRQRQLGKPLACGALKTHR